MIQIFWVETSGLKVQKRAHYEVAEGSWEKAGFAGCGHEPFHCGYPTSCVTLCHVYSLLSSMSPWWYKVVRFSDSVLALLEEGKGRRCVFVCSGRVTALSRLLWYGSNGYTVSRS